MQNWKDQKSQQEQRNLLAGVRKRRVVLDQSSPVRILQRKGDFKNRGILPSASALMLEKTAANDDEEEPTAIGDSSVLNNDEQNSPSPRHPTAERYDDDDANDDIEQEKEESNVKSASPPPKKKDLRELLAEQQQLIRKAEKDDVETYQPMVKNFVEYNESMAEKMWARLGGVS